MKEELGGKIMKKVVALRPKMYSCLTDNGCVNKKANGINKCIIKYKIKFKDYKKCLESNKAKLRLQKRLRRELHNVFTKKVNTLSANNHKRLQTLIE